MIWRAELLNSKTNAVSSQQQYESRQTCACRNCPKHQGLSRHARGKLLENGRWSIHAPARGATASRIAGHAGQDVSIHAHARGATTITDGQIKLFPGFNPRPRTGGDPESVRVFLMDMFQSTPPHGGRHAGRELVQAGLVVSIHAPARGATLHDRHPDTAHNRFNPRPARGATRD